MYVESIEWWDDLCPESYKIAIPEYHLKLKSEKKLDEFTTEIVVASEIAENLKKFLDDVEEGDVEPFDLLSRDCNDDEDYVNVLKAKIA